MNSETRGGTLWSDDGSVSDSLNTQHATRNAPSVAIIIVNYQGREDTLECLASLQSLTYPDCTIYLVDQASGDGTAAVVRASFSSVQVLENKTNNGFAGGNNLGIERALTEGAQYIFLLNNDTTAAPDLIDRLVARAESDARIGIVGALMLYYAEPETVWSAGGSLDAGGRATMLRQGERAEAITDEPFAVDYVVGCGLLVKRAVLESVGLLDERYFLYYEETDFCARVRKAGWRIITEPTARLWHKVSRTTGAESELTLYYMRRNVLFYLKEQGRRPILNVARAVADSLRLAAVWSLQGKHRQRRVLLRALSDFFRNRTGKAEITFL